MTASVALGAAAITAGMSFGVKDKKIVGPAFLGGWAAIAYGLNKHRKGANLLTNSGVAGIVAGGMMARAPMDRGAPKSVGHAGEKIFLSGWAALVAGLAARNGGRAYDYAAAAVAAATVVAGATLIRKTQLMGQLQDLPAVVPALVFATGWYLTVRQMTR